MNVKKMYALTMEHVKIQMAATYVIVRKIFKERIAWKVRISFDKKSLMVTKL